MTAPQTFEAVIYRVGQLRCVDVPPAVSKALADGSGDSGRTPVRVRIGDADEQTSLVPTRSGGHRLFLAAPLRKAAGIDAGDSVELELRPDFRGGEPDLPPELIAALGQVAGGMEELLSRSPADRRQLVRFIEAPKSPQARAGRIAKAVEMVMKGKPKKRR